MHAEAPAGTDPSADLALVDRFCDALWLEDGLSRNTIDAYRRDLALLARWLHGAAHGKLLGVDDTLLSAYFAARHLETRPRRPTGGSRCSAASTSGRCAST